MKIIITGGAGFVGQYLARQLLHRGYVMDANNQRCSIDEIILFDHAEPLVWQEGVRDNCRVVVGDMQDAHAFDDLLGDQVSVFHLASIVSGEGETDFDAAINVNLHGMMNLLESMRKNAGTPLPKIVFASSIATFGGDAMPDTVGDNSKQTPQTTYGVTKAVGELLVNDYSRKGFVDGRSARLPTVIIRPGKPNLAASSFVSGLFREPLRGVDYTIPVAPETLMASSGYRTIVANLIYLHDLGADQLGTDRAVGLPGMNVCVGEMVDALERSPHPQGKIDWQVDEFIQTICKGWPQYLDNQRAIALGFHEDESLHAVIEDYIADFG